MEVKYKNNKAELMDHQHNTELLCSIYYAVPLTLSYRLTAQTHHKQPEPLIPQVLIMRRSNE